MSRKCWRGFTLVELLCQGGRLRSRFRARQPVASLSVVRIRCRAGLVLVDSRLGFCDYV